MTNQERNSVLEEAAKAICHHCAEGLDFTNQERLVHKHKEGENYTNECRARPIYKLMTKEISDVQE